jgi:hypothetical protein
LILLLPSAAGMAKRAAGDIMRGLVQASNGSHLALKMK